MCLQSAAILVSAVLDMENKAHIFCGKLKIETEIEK